MLMPKKVRHRKQQRGRMDGVAKGATRVNFGDYGLQALEPGWITNRQIEAAEAGAEADGAVDGQAAAEPTVTEPPVDDDLERLLAEEEEIERRTREQHHEAPHFRKESD